MTGTSLGAGWRQMREMGKDMNKMHGLNYIKMSKSKLKTFLKQKRKIKPHKIMSGYHMSHQHGRYSNTRI